MKNAVHRVRLASSYHHKLRSHVFCCSLLNVTAASWKLSCEMFSWNEVCQFVANQSAVGNNIFSLKPYVISCTLRSPHFFKNITGTQN